MDKEKQMEKARELFSDMFCRTCRDYKGMTDDPDTGERYCEFCE